MMTAGDGTGPVGGDTFEDAFARVLDDARAHVVAVLEPTIPSPGYLAALAAEIARAETDPDSLPRPELADPDRFWLDVVVPQMRTLRTRFEVAVRSVEVAVVEAMGAAERDLHSLLSSARDRGADAERATLETVLHDHCADLHRRMGELGSELPGLELLAEARAALETDLRARATVDVDSLRAPYLAEAGGDEAHQRFAAQQWVETHPERVAHRVAMLAATSPWRQQELALVGFERSVGLCHDLFATTVERLRAPLPDLPALLLREFDDDGQGG